MKKQLRYFINEGLTHAQCQSIIKEILFPRWANENREEYELILRNKCLRNKFKGKRCFILGNGPSLSDVDLTLLSDEYVFAVNSFMKKKDWEKAIPNFFVFVDYSFFGLSGSNDDWKRCVVISDFSKLSKEKNIQCFMPITAIDFMKSTRLHDKLNVSYFFDERLFRNIFEQNMLSFERNVSIDLAASIPSVSNVLHMAIFIAIYMGFSRIYLLGADTTMVKQYVDVALGNDREEHYCYEDPDKYSEKIIANRVKKNGLQWALNSTRSIIQTYGELRAYCMKNHILLYNLSSTTLVDNIPRMRLEDVLGGKESPIEAVAAETRVEVKADVESVDESVASSD